MSDERTVHATHLPEVNSRSFPGCRYCMRCCRLVWSERRGVTDRGIQPCPGPVQVGFRVPR